MLLTLALFAENVTASDSNRKVVDYWAHYYHNSFAFSVENQSGRPACVTHGGALGRYVVNTGTEKGRIIVSAIITAKASRSNVQVKGADTCNYYSDSEDLLWLHAY